MNLHLKNYLKLFLFFLLTFSLNTIQAQETINICVGESVFLEAIQIFPTGPAGPGGVTPCTPQLYRIEVGPNDAATEVGLQGFNVSPIMTTTYTVTSYGSCGGPGVGGSNSDQSSKQYQIIVDQSCGIDESISICNGESVFLSAIQSSSSMPPSGPIDGGPSGTGPHGGVCPLVLHDIIINPTNTATAVGLQGFNVAPNATTIYSITSNFECGAPGTPRSEKQTKTYEVIIKESCPTTPVPNATIFQDFSWLSSLIDVNNCDGQTVTVYQLGIFKYLLVELSADSKALYFENGTYYCNQTSTYDCVTAYGLTEVVASWNCGLVADPPPPPNCANNSGRFFFENCDGQLYFFLETDDGEILDPYFDAGVTWNPVQNERVNFDYVSAEFSTPCTQAIEAISITCIELAAANENDVFTDFPWLNQLINPNSCRLSDKISIYQAGVHQFVFVESNNSQKLYYQDGSFYCQNSGNFDCVVAYGFGTPVATWSCRNQNVTESMINIRNKVVTDKLSVFPNPTYGPLQVRLPFFSSTAQVRLLDLSGKIIKVFEVAPYTKNQEFNIDISNHERGIYFLELTTDKKRVFEKIIRQ